MNSIKNVIFIITHDIGTELGCYGKPIHSPNLDRFAAAGVRFKNAFTNSPCCSPSRCCLMTGKYAHTTGGIGLAHMGWPLPQDQRTIVDVLNDAGIETAHFGHNHERHAGKNHYQIDEERDWSDSDAAVAVSKAIPYLEARAESSTPFYLNIGIASTHRYYYCRNQEKYGGAVPAEKTYVPLSLPDNENTRKEYGNFLAGVRYMDENVGQLFDVIQRLGLFENTLVIFTTDHGIAASRSKGTLYDRGVETSLLIRAPGTTQTVVDYLVQNIDLAPTVLDAMGVCIPQDMQGNSMLPILKNESYLPHKKIFVERNFHGEMPGNLDHPIDCYDPIRAVRTEKYHYIRWLKPEVKGRSCLPWELKDRMKNEPKENCNTLWPESELLRPKEELYDIKQDPMEFIDLAQKPEYAGIKAELAANLDEWMRSTEDFAVSEKVPSPYEDSGWGHDWPRTDDDFRFSSRVTSMMTNSKNS